MQNVVGNLNEVMNGRPTTGVKRMNRVPLKWRKIDKNVEPQNPTPIKIFFSKMKPKLRESLERFGISY